MGDNKKMKLFLFILFTSIMQLTVSQLWSKSATFTIKDPSTHPYCWQRCNGTGIGFKSGQRCKCVQIKSNCNELCCNEFCEETDRLEGSAFDKCNYINNGICSMYKIKE